MRDEELAELHVGLIARSPEAAVAFEAAMRPFVLGYLRKRGLSDEDADEVWNDAFLVAIQRAPTVIPIGIGLRRFVITVAHNRWVDKVRQAHRYPRTSIEEADKQDPGRAARLNDAQVAAVQDCLERAKPIYAAVMEMASRELTAQEIGQILDITKSNASKLRQRARTWFAECLKGVIDE